MPRNLFGYCAVLILLIIPIFVRPILAAESSYGIASTYSIKDPDISDGDVICFSEKEGSLERCNKEFDNKMFGIYVVTPQVVLRQQAEEEPVVREGRVLANVTNLGGDIKPGDYITSSPIPGKAQKASDTIGYILGTAVGTFIPGEGTKVTYQGKEYVEGKLDLALDIGPLGVLPRGTILDKVGFSLLKGVQNPQGAGLFLRYIAAGLVTIMVTFFAFTNFGKNITKGMESIGRNPLAHNQIQFVIVLNTILIAGVVIGGIIVSIVIIRL